MPAASRRTIHGATATLCLGAILATGCGSSARLEKQLAEMREEMVRVHNDNDRLEERLAAVEADQVARAHPSVRGDTPGVASHPPLKVVRLEPEAEANAAEEPAGQSATPTAPAPDSAAAKNADTTPRPMIKGTGQKVYSTQGGAVSAPIESSAKPAAARGGS